jgi:hypothetical protein
MNNFFNSSDAKTVTVNGATFTAMEVAKVIAFGQKTIQWDGADTWIYPTAATNLLAIFCTDEAGEEREQLIDELAAKVTTGYPTGGKGFNEGFANVIDEAIEQVHKWGSLKLYTCLRKNEDGSRFIDLDKLESMLGFSLGDSVRERLTHVQARKDEDWVFDDATGRSFRDNATVGVLYAIQDAVNLVENVTKEALHFVRRGLTTFEEIANESYAINIDRMTQSDIDDVVQALNDSGVKAEEYTVFFSKQYNDAQCIETSRLNESWTYEPGDELTTFPTHAEAQDFVRAFCGSYRVQKKRAKLAKQIEETQQHLEQLKADLEAVNS